MHKGVLLLFFIFKVTPFNVLRRHFRVYRKNSTVEFEEEVDSKKCVKQAYNGILIFIVTIMEIILTIYVLAKLFHELQILCLRRMHNWRKFWLHRDEIERERLKIETERLEIERGLLSVQREILEVFRLVILALRSKDGDIPSCMKSPI